MRKWKKGILSDYFDRLKLIDKLNKCKKESECVGKRESKLKKSKSVKIV